MEEKNKLVEEHLNRVIKTLEANNIKVNDNQRKRVLDLYLNSDKSLEEITKEINALAEKFMEEYLRIKEEIAKRNQEQKQRKLNELFDCRVTDQTLHMHVIPESIKEDIKEAGGPTKFLETVVDTKLDDALDKVVTLLDEPDYKDITTIMAVSPLLASPQAQEIFRKKGFTTDLTQDEKFTSMFERKKIGEATISKDKLIEQRKKKENQTPELNTMFEEKKEEKKENTLTQEKPKVYVKQQPSNNENKGIVSLESIIATLIIINIIFILFATVNMLIK